MRKSLSLLLMSASLAAAPMAVRAQGVVRGAEHGAREGSRAAGPIGGVVGGVVGGVTGGVAGLLGADQRPRFREYVIHHPHRDFRGYRGRVVVGAVLPPRGVVYYEIPREYGVSRLRYAVVDGHTVLVDPATHRIVQVID